MTTPTIIETDLREVLGEIKQQLNEIQRDVTDLKVDMAIVKTTVSSLEHRMEKMENEQKILVKDVADLKGVKSLIIPIIVAVTTSLVTLLIRSIPNP